MKRLCEFGILLVNPEISQTTKRNSSGDDIIMKILPYTAWLLKKILDSWREAGKRNVMSVGLEFHDKRSETRNGSPSWLSLRMGMLVVRSECRILQEIEFDGSLHEYFRDHRPKERRL